MRRLAAILPIAALMALIALFWGYSLNHDPKVIPMALVGKPVPALSLPPLAGGAPSPIRGLATGPALINFYASWCGPCAQEAPALMALKAEGVKVIGVAYEDQPDAAKAFLTRFGDPYQAVLSDRDGRAGIEFGVTGVPETYAVDAHGVIRAKLAEPITAAEAEEMLQTAAR
ncbi:MAG TPA: DsbE family thiol:disulfide interchange protein [Caulobacteraceae bacterium]